MSQHTFPVRILHVSLGPLLRVHNAIRVDCRVFNGEVGLMAQHVPWQAILEPGWIRVYTPHREHAILARGGLVRFFSAGNLISVVEDIFDADHADAAALRARIEELQMMRASAQEHAEDLERELAWHTLCLEAVEKHLVYLEDTDDEEAQED